MNNFRLLSFNYEQKVNNSTNQGAYRNKTIGSQHKMEHKGKVHSYVEFYAEHEKFCRDFANIDICAYHQDLVNYEEWLKINGNSGNKKR